MVPGPERASRQSHQLSSLLSRARTPIALQNWTAGARTDAQGGPCPQAFGLVLPQLRWGVG